MRKLFALATADTIMGALAAGVAASTAATKATKVTCTTTEYNPTPDKASGVVFGSVAARSRWARMCSR